MFEDIANWIVIISWIVTFFELVGAVIIFYGSGRVVAALVISMIRRQAPDYTAIRLDYTPKILLALDIFVANDLVKTIITPSLEEAIILAFVVGIRTVVGLSLSRELREAAKSESAVNAP